MDTSKSFGTYPETVKDEFRNKVLHIDRRSTLNIGWSGQTSIIFEKVTFVPHILQSCYYEEFSDLRRYLLDIARENPAFITTHFVFNHGQRIYVGSQRATVCLADIISCTIRMDINHILAVLKKVVQALDQISYKGLRYHSLQPSTVFLSQDHNSIQVQLANFGSKISPQWLDPSDGNHDCCAVGDLAYQMMSRRPLTEETLRDSRRKALIMDEYARDVGIDTHFLDDFVKLCMRKRDKAHPSLTPSTRILLNHPFLKGEVDTSCLNPLIHNTILSADVPCWKAFGDD